jgi:hypothetical protein
MVGLVSGVAARRDPRVVLESHALAETPPDRYGCGVSLTVLVR